MQGWMLSVWMLSREMTAPWEPADSSPQQPHRLLGQLKLKLTDHRLPKAHLAVEDLLQKGNSRSSKPKSFALKQKL